MARRAKSEQLVKEIQNNEDDENHPKKQFDEPDWQSELSSWKNRRRKQSEETLMRVAEIKVLEEGDLDPNKRKM